MGGAFGLTAKTPLSMFKYMPGGKTKTFVADNGVHREFCENCGTYICEYGEGNIDKFRYGTPFTSANRLSFLKPDTVQMHDSPSADTS